MFEGQGVSTLKGADQLGDGSFKILSGHPAIRLLLSMVNDIGFRAGHPFLPLGKIKAIYRQ